LLSPKINREAKHGYRLGTIISAKAITYAEIVSDNAAIRGTDGASVTS
jgi:hypothetical protein